MVCVVATGVRNSIVCRPLLPAAAQHLSGPTLIREMQGRKLGLLFSSTKLTHDKWPLVRLVLQQEEDQLQLRRPVHVTLGTTT